MSDVNMALLQGSHRAEGSGWVPRVSAVQQEAIERALAGKSLDMGRLEAYTATGNMADLDPATTTTLREVVRQAKAGLPASQAKRIWPRKCAAVALMKEVG